MTDTTTNKIPHNQETIDVAECLWNLSAMLMNGGLSDAAELHVIQSIDTLATMLARWYSIR
jgi:hypothetical protein